MSKMNPCSFCGNTEVYVYLTDMCRYDNYHVYCEICEKAGPECKEDETRAVEEWNLIPFNPPVLRPGNTVVWTDPENKLPSRTFNIKNVEFTDEGEYDKRIHLTSIDGDSIVCYGDELKEKQ